MSENPGDIPEKIFHEETDEKKPDETPAEKAEVNSLTANHSMAGRDTSETDATETDTPETDVPETDATETDTPETDTAETDAAPGEVITEEDQNEPLTNLVIRRVRTEPVDVIPPAPKDRGFLYSLLDTARFISLGLVIGILLVVFVVQRNDVYGPSMEPNLHEKDAVFVEMISRYFTTPERGDIMTINATGMPGYTKKEKIIKRVIGLPGETVTIKDGSVFINGVLLDEPYLADNVPTYINNDGAASGYDNITLGKDEYFFMGDNRGASLDSRVIGPVPASRIKAHVIAKIYPFNDMGLL